MRSNLEEIVEWVELFGEKRNAGRYMIFFMMGIFLVRCASDAGEVEKDFFWKRPSIFSAVANSLCAGSKDSRSSAQAACNRYRVFNGLLNYFFFATRLNEHEQKH